MLTEVWPLRRSENVVIQKHCVRCPRHCNSRSQHRDQRRSLVPNGHFDYALLVEKEVQPVRITVQRANAIRRFDDSQRRWQISFSDDFGGRFSGGYGGTLRNEVLADTLGDRKSVV